MPLALQLLMQPDTHGAPAEGAGYAAPHQTGAPQRADARHNGGRTANCPHTGPSPETAAVSDHIFTISPLKWAMINCPEALGKRLMPASGTGPALNKGRTVHPNPENNRATPKIRDSGTMLPGHGFGCWTHPNQAGIGGGTGQEPSEKTAAPSGLWTGRYFWAIRVRPRLGTAHGEAGKSRMPQDSLLHQSGRQESLSEAYVHAVAAAAGYTTAAYNRDMIKADVLIQAGGYLSPLLAIQLKATIRLRPVLAQDGVQLPAGRSYLRSPAEPRPNPPDCLWSWTCRDPRMNGSASPPRNS